MQIVGLAADRCRSEWSFGLLLICSGPCQPRRIVRLSDVASEAAVRTLDAAVPVAVGELPRRRLSCRGSTAASRAAGLGHRCPVTLDPAVEPRGDRRGGGEGLGWLGA